MTTDLAIDYNTGDLVVSPTKDLDIRTGQGTVDQRIRVRLRVWYGEWDIDPTLGSRLHDILRMPNWRAEGEAELVIREALEPMEDIIVQDVKVDMSETDSRTIQVGITYTLIEPTDEPAEPFQLTTSLGVSE